jgi:hypothetical protein
MAQRRRAPLPPRDFARRGLPIERIPTGTALLRIHRLGVGPIFFGMSSANRFDDPRGTYGVCYLARTIEGAFAETCLRDVGAQFVALGFVAERAVARIETLHTLRLVAVHGAGLARLGATAAVSSGAYGPAQAWSRAIHQHPAHVDGLSYRSTHDNSQRCVALFDRGERHIRLVESTPLTTDRVRLGMLLDRYGVGLG